MKDGHEVYAKLQTVTTHELATVPYLPALYNVGEKFINLRKKGVTGAMLCWNFGNFLSHNTELGNWFSWAPLPEKADHILKIMATRDFGVKAAADVLGAWKHFNKSLEHFPFNAAFVTGGMHNFGPAYPLVLKVNNKHLPCNWLLPREVKYNCTFAAMQYTEFGDRLDVVCGAWGPSRTIKSLKLMLKEWQKGIAILAMTENSIPAKLKKNYEKEYNIAAAFFVQYTSTINFMEFTCLRNTLQKEKSINKNNKILLLMKQIAVQEIKNAELGKKLAEKELSLGFHGEAFGYMYTPEKIERKIEKVKNLIQKELPQYLEKLT